MNQYAGEYMYFRCIQYILEVISNSSQQKIANLLFFITKVKRGPFFEHSPMLNDIATLMSWSKVNTGMTKMYIAEVLKKVPVVQHFKFGTLFPFDQRQQ